MCASEQEPTGHVYMEMMVCPDWPVPKHALYAWAPTHVCTHIPNLKIHWGGHPGVMETKILRITAKYQSHHRHWYMSAEEGRQGTVGDDTAPTAETHPLSFSTLYKSGLNG